MAPFDTAPFPAAPRPAGNGPVTGMSSQRVAIGVSGRDEAAGVVTGCGWAAAARSCHIAGDCAAKVAAPPVSDADANSGVS